MKRGVARLAGWAAICLFAAVAVSASETITYTYDALGRLVTVASSGSVNNGQNVATTYDAAGNRTNQTVTGAATSAQLSIGNASVTEGGALSFIVTRSGVTTTVVSASYDTANGTAVAPGDYTSTTSGTVNFAANDTSETITVTTTDDAAIESAETMSVTLSNALGGATITTAVGTGTINDNDVAAQLAIGNASVTEGGTLSFTVTRSGDTTSAVSASYASAGGTATSGSDFITASGTVSFAANDTSETITVSTTDDAAVESAETMSVTLSNPSSGATITTATGTGTINDNDAPAFSISDATASEGDNLNFTVTVGAHSGTISVTATTSDGTAIAGSDYTTKSQSVSFTSNQTSKTFFVVTTEDGTSEATETMNVTLSNPSGGTTIADGSATGTINDDDAAVANLAIGNASVTEGGSLSFTVTRSGVTTTAVSASFASASGTATSGSDFTAASGTVSFAANDTSETITVNTTDDATVESAETMSVTLSNPSSGAAITTATGTGTINDNDSPPANLAIGNASVTEGATLSFTVTRSGNTSIAASASYATANITAVAPGDYTTKSGTVSFTSGQTSKTITVTTIDDATVESAETMKVTLSNPSSGAAITTAIGTGTLNDNDAPNTPPVAVNDTTTAYCFVAKFVNLTANDTDADGDYPLSITNIYQISGPAGSPSMIIDSASTVELEASTAGQSVFEYTITDTRGATDTGNLTVTVPSGGC